MNKESVLIMPKSVLELFNQKEVLNYLKERKFPAMMGEELFPEVKKQSLEFEVLTNASKTPVIASVHGFDTESEIGQREAEKKAIELALIKRKMQLKEKEIVKAAEGSNGGYMLEKRPEEISLMDVINCTESTMAISRCLEKDGYGTGTAEERKEYHETVLGYGFSACCCIES